ncbi:unnamed protein product [Amoebophrya sp. A120]|nr:unnamed protein product [Amoebophrya sp. A120]|eukprot:GSA120T00015357001.1
MALVFPSSARWFSVKFKKPPSPNYDNIRRVVYTKFEPIHFILKNDCGGGPYIWDQFYYGLLCSPKFEGLTYPAMYEMFHKEMAAIGMTQNRLRVTLQPPSRFHLMRRAVRWRWGIDC